jgi:EAL domain-containing protein (putative c-di-GMP-specific phosphodiesterase class I)/GGDEF domain-containing protein
MEVFMATPTTASRTKLTPMPEGAPRWLRELTITAHFQPIVDLLTAAPVAYETLSRSAAGDVTPEQIFEEARAQSCLWDVERICRSAIVSAIAALPDELRDSTYFMNVSPHVLGDPRFQNGFTRRQLHKHGFDHRRVVIEITERDSIRDPEQFRQVVRHYVDQGFRIAVDDFGSGNSGLLTLIRTLPHVVKLDMGIVRDVHLHSYQQLLVRALVSFTSNVECRLVAEGVETWDELEVLMRLGVRYAQGFLLARPAPCPPSLAPAVRDRLLDLMRRTYLRLGESDETVAALVVRRETAEAGSLTVDELDRQFRHNPGLDHLALLREGRPAGLITRSGCATLTSGPFGWPLAQRKPADVLADHQPLTVEEATPITRLARLAMDRPPESLYEPVVVVAGDGRFVGTVTMKQVITRSTELEVQTAQDANPLTGLPGNRSIEKWIRAALSCERYSIAYADLDRFKEFNDAYGFVRGDEMIRHQARALADTLGRWHPEARIGHIGGDDFVVVSTDRLCPLALDEICTAFDRLKESLFRPDDLARRTFRATDRRGQQSDVPLVTLSVAVIDSDKVGSEVHPALFGQLAASLKKHVKALSAKEGRSRFLFERRSRAEEVDLFNDRLLDALPREPPPARGS